MSARSVLRSFAPLFAALVCSTAAHAQLFRAYLSIDGSDANSCTLPAPCRLLPAAIAAVADGGEIWMLDSANYNSGPVNISKSVNIIAVPGALGSIVALGGRAIEVVTPGVKVALRNLVIAPFPGGGGTGGINLPGLGAGLTVENCLIANLPGIGINVEGSATVRIVDSIIRDNLGNGLRLLNGAKATIVRSMVSGNGHSGVLVQGLASGTLTTADITSSTIEGNAIHGVYAVSGVSSTAAVNVSIRDSQLVRNSAGATSESNAGAPVTLSASNNVITNNGYGILTGNAGGKIWLTGNTISENQYGISNAAAAVIESAGDNAVRNNVNDTSGTITPIAKQ